MSCRAKLVESWQARARAENFSCQTSPEKNAAAAQVKTEAHTTTSDYDTAAADDKAGGDSDRTHSSEDEDEDDNYEERNDSEDKSNGGGSSKITFWIQRVYEVGLAF